MQKPSIPKGTRDFSPKEMVKRKYIFNIIENVFKQHGFKPIETPTMENLSTLTGKYGDEGDTLLFKVLNSGDYLKKVNEPDLKKENYNKLIPQIAEKGLRYDLTVPFARYVVMHQNDITYPFKRYQIQPVWRADRPQRGRYREFYQCDVDIIGSDSLLNEVELIQIYDKVFHQLGINVTIKVNNRKLLDALTYLIQAQQYFKEIVTAIDKLDKIGKDGVINELIENAILSKETATWFLNIIDSYDFSESGLRELTDALKISWAENKSLEEIDRMLPADEVGVGFTYSAWKAVNELKQINYYLRNVPIYNKVELDTSLARGLNYYTGAIFEVVAEGVKIGSVGGGGRYDDLTGIFGLKGVSGVGCSFGADRIYDVMEELNIFPQSTDKFTELIFCCMSEAAINYCLPMAEELRKHHITVEIYPGTAKLKKQLDYANKNNIPYAIVVGDDEVSSGELVLKNMITGNQDKLPFGAILEKLGE